MRVIFIDLHCNSFLMKPWREFFRHEQSQRKKQGFILRWLIDHDVRVANLVTLEGTTLPTKTLRKMTGAMFWRNLEANKVAEKNGFKKGQIAVISEQEIEPSDVLVLYGTFGTILGEKLKCRKIVDLIHFYGFRARAEELKKTGVKDYLFDVNLEKYSGLFNKNMSFLREGFHENGFAFQDRFQVKTEFRNRKRKAVAIGTSTTTDSREFFEEYGTYEYQPLRHMLYRGAYLYPDEIDSVISKYVDSTYRVIKDNDLWLVKKIKIANNLLRSGKQKEYYSFDMVDKLNEYQMFVCPEDINGSPGIGTIEGMACGTALIGHDYGALEDMGLEAGRHYIPYDGSMEGLAAVIQYWQRPENQEGLRQIAAEGCKYVRSHYNEEKVAEAYYKTLMDL